MKKNWTTKLLVAATCALFVAGPVMATDYSSYTLQELSQMRGSMMDKSQEERNAFRDAWRQKMQEASPEERAQYSRGWGSRGSGNSGQGHHYGQGQWGQGAGGSGGCCSGSGNGHGRGHR